MVTNVITISLDEDTIRILELIPKRHRSEFIRKQVLKYDKNNILPSMLEINERLRHNKQFEIELIDFVNKCTVKLKE